MELVARAVVIVSLQILVHPLRAGAVRGVEVGFLGAVGVDLHKHPVRPPHDADPQVHPQINPARRHGCMAGHIRVLEARQQAPLALPPVEAKRALDQQEITAVR